MLLLPVYTHYLAPEDYGCLAILDLTAALVAIVAHGAMPQAVNRQHFAAADERERDAVWWTGVTAVALLGILVLAPAWALRGPLAAMALGDSHPEGANLLLLVFPTLWLGAISGLLEVYLRVQKWSIGYVATSFVRLAVNATLNVTFLAAGLGVLGVLIANLVTGALYAAALLVIFVLTRGPYSFLPSVCWRLLKFGGPLVGTGLIAMLLHQVDRFFLRMYCPFADVGRYSLAYQFGFGINAILLVPFGSIWNVLQFEVASQRDANTVYHTVFTYFTRVLTVVMVGISLFAVPIVHALAGDRFSQAAGLVPVVCLAYYFFSFTTFTNLPASLSQRTGRLLPGSLAALCFNVTANNFFIPRYGVAAAPWVAVGTFLLLCVINYVACRGLCGVSFPYSRALFAASPGVTLYLAHSSLFSPDDSLAYYGLGCFGWLVYALVLFRRPLRMAISFRPRRQASGSAGCQRYLDDGDQGAGQRPTPTDSHETSPQFDIARS